MGQDIHDGLCQQLVSLAFDANALEHQLSAQSRPESATARRICAHLDGAITESRQLSRGLFPVRLEAEGLISALEELANATQSRFGVNCSLHAQKPPPVADNTVATSLFRIAQEAVNNAVKHGPAKAISIKLRSPANQLELTVEDDGAGLPDLPKKREGMGLHIMAYRARSIGGTLCVSRRPEGGTVVSCCAPIRRP
jgi:signal transduction histidine kinase